MPNLSLKRLLSKQFLIWMLSTDLSWVSGCLDCNARLVQKHRKWLNGQYCLPEMLDSLQSNRVQFRILAPLGVNSLSPYSPCNHSASEHLSAPQWCSGWPKPERCPPCIDWGHLTVILSHPETQVHPFQVGLTEGVVDVSVGCVDDKLPGCQEEKSSQDW